MSTQQQAENAQVIPLSEPNFLRENWKAALAIGSNEGLKFIRVGDGIANVTNGTVLLRVPMPVPDGFYLLGHSNELIPADGTSSPRWLLYPDTATCRPRFDRMKPSPLIHRGIVRELIDFAEVVRRTGTRYHSQLVVDSNGFYGSDELGFNMPFPILEPGDELLVDPVQLKIALTEMLRYEGIHIAREEHIPGKELPLFFGLDWERCALLQPLVDRWKPRLKYH